MASWREASNVLQWLQTCSWNRFEDLRENTNRSSNLTTDLHWSPHRQIMGHTVGNLRWHHIHGHRLLCRQRQYSSQTIVFDLSQLFSIGGFKLRCRSGKKRKLDDNMASFSERMMVRLQALPGPYFNEIEMQSPPDLYPQEFVPKSYPQPRAQTYSRVVPKMDGRYSSAKNAVRPPFGINLIQHYLEWKENSKRWAGSNQGDTSRNSSLPNGNELVMAAA